MQKYKMQVCKIINNSDDNEINNILLKWYEDSENWKWEETKHLQYYDK